MFAALSVQIHLKTKGDINIRNKTKQVPSECFLIQLQSDLGKKRRKRRTKNICGCVLLKYKSCY